MPYNTLNVRGNMKRIGTESKLEIDRLRMATDFRFVHIIIVFAAVVDSVRDNLPVGKWPMKS